jgi:hypothetical protein
VPTRRAPFAAILAAVVLAGCGGGDDTATVRVETMRLRTGSMPPVPPVGERLDTAALDALGGWQAVAIPDPWGLRRRARSLEGWYRADLVLPSDRRDWALHIDGAWRDLVLFANGERIGAMARAGPPPVGQHLWSAALLAPLPERADRVSLLVHYRTAPAEIGALIDVSAGPRAALEARARARTLLRSTIPAALALIGVASGLMALVLARYSRDRGVYWFAWATTTWCLAALIPTQPDAPGGWLASVVSHAFVPSVALGLHRLLGLARPRIELLLAASVAIGAVARGVVPAVGIPFVATSSSGSISCRSRSRRRAGVRRVERAGFSSAASCSSRRASTTSRASPRSG